MSFESYSNERPGRGWYDLIGVIINEMEVQEKETHMQLQISSKKKLMETLKYSI